MNIVNNIDVRKKNKVVNSGQSGFTLIELSIVIIITGLLFVPLVRAYYIYQTQQNIDKTREAVDLASFMALSFGANGEYPCPADASLAPNNPLYGVSQCATAAGLPSTGTACTAGGGLCALPGARQINSVNKRVLLGAIPWVTIIEEEELLYSSKDIMDAWGSRIMYAVSEDLTNSITFKSYNGVIGAIDEYGQPTAGVENDASIAVFSVGRDQRGGFSETGTLNAACATSASSKDFDNCDNLDGTFTQALGYYLETSGDKYYDDDITFIKDLNSPLWEYFTDIPGVEGHVQTTFDGNVGIGTNTPTAKLDIENGLGSAELSTDNIVLTKQICDEDRNNCWNIEAITGNDPNMLCDPGYVMVGISQGTITNIDAGGSINNCVLLTFSAASPTPDQACPVGRYITGFESDGDIICTP